MDHNDKLPPLEIVKHDDDGLITITFPKPFRPSVNLLLCFLYDGVGVDFIKKRGKVYVSSITCSPYQWLQYLLEWGLALKLPMEKIKEAQQRFEEWLKKGE
jgi:hypothetical protein